MVSVGKNTLPEPILVGREQELNQLKQYLDLATKGEGNTVLISGGAGCGKTRIATDFLNSARKKGIDILSGWCLSNSTVPFFPFLEAFDSYFTSNQNNNQGLFSQQLEIKTRLVEGLNTNGKNEASSPQSWKDHAFAAVAKELLLYSNNKMLILFIDDLQWADSASLSLLHYISRNIKKEKILIIATFRSEELGENNGALQDTLRLLSREDLFSEVKLTNFNYQQVVEVAQSMLGGELDSQLAEKLTKESGGNPLFLIEALRFLTEQDNLTNELGKWHLQNEKVGLPLKVKDIILRRVSRLTPQQRRILDVASVVGDKFDPELVGAVLEQDSLRILESLNDIAHNNSLVSSDEKYFKFDHAKSRETLYEEIFPPLRIGYHARIAEKIETIATPNKPRVSDLAYHYRKADNFDKSIHYSLLAGLDSIARFSNTEAIQHFTYVLGIIGDNTDYLEEKESALEGLGDALYASSSYQQAVNTFEKLFASENNALKQRVLRKAIDAAFFQGDLSYFAKLVKIGEEVPSADRLESARIKINRARVNQLFEHNITLALKDNEEALSIFEEENSLWDVAWASISFGGSMALLGKLEEGLASNVRAVELFKQLGEQRWLARAYIRTGGILSGYQLHNQSYSYFSNAATIFEKIGDFGMLSDAYASWSVALEAAGDIENAIAKGLKAIEISYKTDSKWANSIAYSALIRQYAKIGDLHQAEKYFNILNTFLPETLSHLNVHMPLTRAVFFAAKKQWTKSQEYFREYYNYLKTFKKNPEEDSFMLNYTGWALEKQGKTDEAKNRFTAIAEISKYLNNRFAHAPIQGSIIVTPKPLVGQKITLRVDIMNVSSNDVWVLSLESFVPTNFKLSLPITWSFKNGTLTLPEQKIAPFSVKTINISLTPLKANNFVLSPKILYKNEISNQNKAMLKAFKITVEDKKDSELPNIHQDQISFQCTSAEKAFNYLISSFKDDFLKQKNQIENCGWRTLMDIVNKAHVSKYSMYGPSGQGKGINELKGLNLIETRIFSGERGRGGKITKFRINYRKETFDLSS
jgi:predicted ATPase